MKYKTKFSYSSGLLFCLLPSPIFITSQISMWQKKKKKEQWSLLGLESKTSTGINRQTSDQVLYFKTVIS